MAVACAWDFIWWFVEAPIISLLYLIEIKKLNLFKYNDAYDLINSFRLQLLL